VWLDSASTLKSITSIFTAKTQEDIIVPSMSGRKKKEAPLLVSKAIAMYKEKVRLRRS